MSTVIKEYGLKVRKNKSKVVCIHAIRGSRRWNNCVTYIDETEEYKYLGGPIGGFKCMGDRMKKK